MQIEIQQEKIDSIIESEITKFVQNRMTERTYDIAKESERQFNIAFRWEYWDNKKFTSEISEEVKKRADEQIDKYFQEWFDKKLQESFRHRINDFVRSHLDEELKRAFQNLKVWFYDEDSDIENYMWEIINDASNWAYEAGCRDGYNNR